MSNTNRIQLLSGILDECHNTMLDLYTYCQEEGSEPLTCKGISQRAKLLRYELQAAVAMSLTIVHTGSGWPPEAEDLITLKGERSGYPVDLVSGLLSKAEASTALVLLALQHPQLNPLKPSSLPSFVTDSTLATGLWSVMTLLQQVTSILEYTSPSRDSALAAA